MEDPSECWTCDIVFEYVGLANRFTQDLSAGLLPGMWALFGAIVGIWIIFHGYQFVVAGRGEIDRVVREFFPVMIASLLLSGQGPELVNNVFSVTMDTMGAAAGFALSVGGGLGYENCPAYTAVQNEETGLVPLVAAAECGVMNVFDIGDEIVDSAGGWGDTAIAILFAILLVIPYFLVLVVFFAQVVMAIFRVLMIAALSPFLMLGFGFGWGRPMAAAGVRTVLSAFMVLFGCTTALAVMLYGVAGIDALGTDQSWKGADLLESRYLIAVALGALGWAFMIEATAIANSITGSVLSNSGVAAIGGQALAGAAMVARNPARMMAEGAGNLYRAGTGAAGYGTGAASEGARRLIERFRNHNGGFSQ